MNDITTQDRWNAAVYELRKAGIKFRTNVRKCCRGCITDEDLRMTDADQPYGFTYGGQGCAIKWEGGEPVEQGRSWSRDMVPATVAYVNHGNGAAETIAAVFASHGFAVEWDGSEYRCVEIHFAAPAA